MINNTTDELSDCIKETPAVLVQNLCSMEYYQHINCAIAPKQVLHDISFSALSGEVCVITSKDTYEIKLLLDIISNVTPYQKGSCSLNHHGMMRRKKAIVEDLFYIASTNMLFDNMTVLEYLTLITKESKISLAKRQLQILDYLCELELGYISLTPITFLTPAEKTLILLISAYYSNCPIVMMNLPRITYSQNLIAIAVKIFKQLKDKNICVVCSTNDVNFTQAICDKIVIVKNGTVLLQQPFEDLINEYDKLCYTIDLEQGVPMVDCNSMQNFDITYKFNTIRLYTASQIMPLLNVLEDKQISVKQVIKHTPHIKDALEIILGGEDNV